jgi:vitamin B12 transporter
MGRAFGGTVAVNWVGAVSDSVAGTPIGYGNYAVVDVSGRYLIGADRKQQLNVSLQNALDEEYGRPSQGCADVATDGPDDCSAPYAYVNLGLPRTLRVSYTHRF